MTAPEKPVDWERIELEYRTSSLSLREIAALHPNTNHVAISRRAKRDGWIREAAVTGGPVTPRVTADRAVTVKQAGGRKPRLTEDQWRDIGERLLSGETCGALAREFGVAKSTISERFAERNRTVREVAEKLVQAESAALALPAPEQRAARGLASKLMEISEHIASAATYGAATAHRLAGIAHAKVQEIDDAAPLDDESREALKDVAVLTRMSNDAGTLAINLLSANKDRVSRTVDAAEVIENEPTNIASIPVLEAAKAYQDFISG